LLPANYPEIRCVVRGVRLGILRDFHLNDGRYRTWNQRIRELLAE
jgi:hypothetical protein